MQQGVRDTSSLHDKRENASDAALIDRFKHDPEGAFSELLERFSPIILRMIRRFMNDPDEVMEVYTAICERLQTNDYKALRRFRINSELTPWLSVVVANACRDRFRKKRMTSMPNSVLTRLDEREKLVFKYYYQDHMPHEEIAHTISSKHDMPCTSYEVLKATEKINDMLTINKRWHLLSALNFNRAMLSIDELRDIGYQPPSNENGEEIDVALRSRNQVKQLNAALAQLQAEDQLLVLLRYEHGMKANQIAKVMNYESHKYVYTRLRTIVNRLRRILGES